MKTEISARFETRALAEDIVKFLSRGTYHLAHGEYSRPTYTVRKIRGEDGFEIYITRYYYPGTFYAKKSGVMDALDARECAFMMNEYGDMLN